MADDLPLYKPGDLQVGDIITIPKDQYGHPKLRVDPKTRQVAEPRELQRFRVAECHLNEDGTIRMARLEPYHG